MSIKLKPARAFDGGLFATVTRTMPICEVTAQRLCSLRRMEEAISSMRCQIEWNLVHNLPHQTDLVFPWESMVREHCKLLETFPESFKDVTS